MIFFSCSLCWLAGWLTGKQAVCVCMCVCERACVYYRYSVLNLGYRSSSMYNRHTTGNGCFCCYCCSFIFNFFFIYLYQKRKEWTNGNLLSVVSLTIWWFLSTNTYFHVRMWLHVCVYVCYRSSLFIESGFCDEQWWWLRFQMDQSQCQHTKIVEHTKEKKTTKWILWNFLIHCIDRFVNIFFLIW